MDTGRWRVGEGPAFGAEGLALGLFFFGPIGMEGFVTGGKDGVRGMVD